MINAGARPTDARDSGVSLMAAVENIGSPQGTGRRWLLSAAVAAAATVAAYLVFLPWGAKKTLGPDGYLHGPYTTAEVVGLIVALLAIGIAVGWFGSWQALWVMPPVLTLVWVLQAVSDQQSDNDGLWIIGAGLVLVGSGLVTLVVVLVGSAIHRHRHSVKVADALRSGGQAPR
jgi:hypothetical protein